MDVCINKTKSCRGSWMCTNIAMIDHKRRPGQPPSSIQSAFAHESLGSCVHQRLSNVPILAMADIEATHSFFANVLHAMYVRA